MTRWQRAAWVLLGALVPRVGARRWWPAWPVEPRGDSIRLGGLVALTALLAAGNLLAQLSQERFSPQEMHAGGARWIASALEQQEGRALDTPLLLALAAVLRCGSSTLSPAVAALRDRLLASQQSDGAFGPRAADTWHALAALLAANDTESVLARSRALEALGRQGSGSAAGRPGGHLPEDVEQALQFLASSQPAPGAVRHFDPAWVELYAVAGGPFDVCAAYQGLQGRDSLSPPGNLPGLAGLGPLHEVLVVALILDGYRTSWLAGRQGAAISWAEQLLSAIGVLWNEDDGAWGQRPGGPPDLAATACALLALDVLEPRLLHPSASAATDAADDRPADLRTDCVECHQQLNPRLHAQWASSVHAQVGVDCATCHGKNHSRIFREEGRVSVSVCGRCHERAVVEFSRSRHAVAMDTLLSSRLLAETPEAARAACHGCHQIGRPGPDGQAGSCNYCHPGHEFRAANGREPEACIVCHTGADYPQDAAYRLSKHGALYNVDRNAELAPTCATCHHPGGTHDDGFGLTLGRSGVGAVLADRLPPIPMPTIQADEFARARADMVRVCTECHSSRLAQASLRQADRLKQEGDGLLQEAVTLLRELHGEELLGLPADEDLLLGSEQAHVDPALPGAPLLERFYEMWRYRYTSSWKGAYHNSFSIANHGSLSGLHEDLASLRADAERLRARGVR